MKTFNKTIQVEVSVDAIANKLLTMFDTKEAHRELVVETIIGNMINTRSTKEMSMLYSSLNGYTNDINFEVGQEVNCSETKTFYSKENDSTKIISNYREIGQATVISKDIYKENKLEISFPFMDSDGKMIEKTLWVNHTKCNLVPQSKAIKLTDLIAE